MRIRLFRVAMEMVPVPEQVTVEQVTVEPVMATMEMVIIREIRTMAVINIQK